MQSPKFEQLWKTLNERVHTRLVDLLRGQGKHVNNNGQIVLNIQPVIVKVNAAATKFGISGLSKAASQNSHDIVLLSLSTLKQAQSAVRVLDDLAIALPIITVLLFAGAILASGNRRRTVLRSALGVACRDAAVPVHLELRAESIRTRFACQREPSRRWRGL